MKILGWIFFFILNSSNVGLQVLQVIPALVILRSRQKGLFIGMRILKKNNHLPSQIELFFFSSLYQVCVI